VSELAKAYTPNLKAGFLGAAVVLRANILAHFISVRERAKLTAVFVFLGGEAICKHFLHELRSFNSSLFSFVFGFKIKLSCSG